LELQGYDFDVIHKKGSTNQNADALSRRIYTVKPGTSVEVKPFALDSAQNTAALTPVTVTQEPCIAVGVDVSATVENQNANTLAHSEFTNVSSVSVAVECKKDEDQDIYTFPFQESDFEEPETVEVCFQYHDISCVMDASVTHKTLVNSENFEPISLDPDKILSNSNKDNDKNKQIWENHEIIKYQKECDDFKDLYMYLAARNLPEDKELAERTVRES
jgi:hypothetical protein